MKVIVLLDQIQAGLGGKEKADTELGVKNWRWGRQTPWQRTCKSRIPT